jgi:putative ABC transport system permease protein
MDYIRGKSLGFDTEQVVLVPLRTAQASRQYTTLKASFDQIGGVNAVSGTSSIPSSPLFRDWSLFKEGSSNDQSVRHDIVHVDMDYFEVLKVDLLAGRDFVLDQDNLESDTISPTKMIVNEASLHTFQIPLENALGSKIYFEPEPGQRYTFSIIGVVKDFHQFSLHRKISPMMFILPGERTFFPYMALSVDMNSYAAISEKMKRMWEEQIDDAPFESIFLNDNVKRLYAAESRTSSMLTISTTIAVIISCLGLYGLSVYVAERKTKEIGIRKVVGASVQSIVGMLSTEYIKLIIISFALSVPLGYYFMVRWLEGFAYKIDPGVGVFLMSGLISFFIAWLTISFESFRAANKNPVETFRIN